MSPKDKCQRKSIRSGNWGDRSTNVAVVRGVSATRAVRMQPGGMLLVLSTSGKDPRGRQLAYSVFLLFHFQLFNQRGGSVGSRDDVLVDTQAPVRSQFAFVDIRLLNLDVRVF